MRLVIQTWTDNDILRKVSAPVKPAELHTYRVLWESMLDYIDNPKNKGIGLAAPQVGVNKRIAVVGLPIKQDDEDYPLVLMINPVITNRSKETEIGEEGCLSLPDLRWEVERSLWIDVEWIDIRGRKIKKHITGFGAKVVQHEIDHLDGILISDKFVQKKASKVVK